MRCTHSEVNGSPYWQLMPVSPTTTHIFQILFLVVYSCNCSPEWSGNLCAVRYDDCRNAGHDLCVHGLCIDADRIIPGQVTSDLLLLLILFINQMFSIILLPSSANTNLLALPFETPP